MKENKFRAWNELGNSMVSCDNWTMRHLMSNDSTFKVMQYTGLKDKNGKGKEVYHKDLMRTTSEYPYLIDWISDGWYACRGDGQENIPLRMFLISFPDSEVIGNEYEQ